MRYQSTPYNCGPASVQNALEIHRFRVAQAVLATEGGTTEELGTDEEGIKRMVLSQGFEPDEFSTDLSLTAWGWVWNSLLMGRPVVLCVEQWSHWVCVVGACGKNVLVADPARHEWNKKRNGIRVMPRSTLLREWEAGKRVRGSLDRFYGIGVGPR